MQSFKYTKLASEGTENQQRPELHTKMWTKKISNVKGINNKKLWYTKHSHILYMDNYQHLPSPNLHCSRENQLEQANK